VGAADCEHEQHGIQPDEGRAPARGLSESRGRPRDECDRGEARRDCDGFHHPQPTGEPEGDARVAREREQGTVGGVLEGPSDEREDRIARCFGGHMRVRIQPMQRAHPRKRQVSEDVLGEQRRRERESQVRRHDRRRDHAERQPASGEQHQHVGGAHDQRQGLEAVPAEARAELLERPGDPAGPPATAPRDEFRGLRGRVGAQQQNRRDDAHQAERTERRCDPRGRPCAGAPARPRRPIRCDADIRYRGGGLHPLHCCAWPVDASNHALVQRSR
jgi:hypothetical protein